MVFKRRNPRSWLRILAESVWPRGGWARAGRYVLHRLRRLPDPAHKISRGIAAGVFTSFTPLFGFHFVIAALSALLLRGNILASLLATFVGNPLTFPFIASISVEIGSWMLGKPPIPLHRVFTSFTHASIELWRNFTAIFTPATTHWDRLDSFFADVFLPYLVGGFLPGIAAGLAAYYLSYPVIIAYQKARIKRMKTRYEKRRAQAAARAAERAAEQAQGSGA